MTGTSTQLIQASVRHSRYSQAEDRTAWYGIDDPKKRKQVQDRIAQRARRKRLAASKAGSSSSLDVSLCSSPEASSVCSCQSTDSDQSNMSLVVSARTLAPMTVDHNLLRDPNTSAYTALFRNGLILGLTCGICIADKSHTVPKDVPEPLQPTAKQLLTLHYPWIDRFPFPTMRDHAIELSGIIDGEEFIHDLFMMQSFDVIAGYESWDPRGWRMGAEFAKKWGYLFY